MGDKLADALKNGLLNKETGMRKKLNVRVIAACDSNLKRLADKGLFSRSLYELVLDTTIRVPPLRERSKDIEVIAAHILAEMSAPAVLKGMQKPERHTGEGKILSHTLPNGKNLTFRQSEVLQHLSNGLSNKQIAYEMKVSEFFCLLA